MTLRLEQELRLWAQLARTQGATLSADLIARAADAIGSGRKDPGLAEQLALASTIAAKGGHGGLAQSLQRASEALSASPPSESSGSDAPKG